MSEKNAPLSKKRRRSILLHISAAACTCLVLSILKYRERAEAFRCEKPRIFVGVFTGPGAGSKYTSRRASLRATWFPHTKEALTRLECELGITLRFVVGRVAWTNDTLGSRAWQNEMSLHGDFLVVDTIDSYHNLSAKTSEYFKHVLKLRAYDYVIKMDDDMFLSPQHLAKAVDQWKNMNVDYVGCMQRPEVIKNQSHVWYEPIHDLLASGYHMYANGPMYALSRSAVLQLFHRQAQSNRLLNNEDASIGLWMLARNAVFFDDRRLCADKCHESHAFVAVRNPPIDWEHGGMANPMVELPMFFGRAECRAAPPPVLPFLKSPFKRFNVMIHDFLSQ